MNDRTREQIDKLAGTLERMRLDEYIEHVSNRKRLVMDNLLYGLVRGFGFMIGFSVLGALAVVLLKHLVLESIPGIGGFVAEVIDAIEKSR